MGAVPEVVEGGRRMPAPRATTNARRDVEDPRITEAYARRVAREAYAWAWPMVNMFNRRLASRRVTERGLLNGVEPVAPLNFLAMMPGPVDVRRAVALSEPGLAMGVGVLALDQSAVVLQVPDFGRRFWFYQAFDLRSERFATIGARHGTRPGFYLIAGPDWDGDKPDDILGVLPCPTSTGMLIPRVHPGDTSDELRVIREVLSMVDLYPVARYDGNVKARDWTRLPSLSPARDAIASQRVRPETFFELLPAALADAPPREGEEMRYDQALAVLDAASRDAGLHDAMIEEAIVAHRSLVEPQLDGLWLPSPVLRTPE